MSDQTAQEPSMEEILASIRRIISDDEEEAGGAPEEAAAEQAEPDAPEPEPASSLDDVDDVLELTEVVGDDGNVVSLNDAMAEPPVSDQPAEADEPLAPIEPQSPLLSEAPEAQAAGSIAELMVGLSSATLLGDGDKTLEELVKDLLRPLLKRWLDDHLPPMVEQIVREELERVIARGRGR